MKPDQREAFRELYNACYGNLYRYVQQQSNEGADVSGIVQDIVWQAYRLFTNYQGETSYQVWLFSIAHAVQSGWRKRLRKSKQAAPLEGEPADAGLIAEVAGEDGEALRRRMIFQVAAAVRRLPRRERDVLALETVYGFTRPDLSVILDLSEGRLDILAGDAYLHLITNLETTARSFVDEALHSLYGKPSDLELAQQKAATWEQLMKRSKRAAMRKRWLPVAGVAVVAAIVGTVVFLPGELKKSIVSAPANTQPAEELIEVPAVKEGAATLEALRLRMRYYQAKHYQLIYSDPVTYNVDLIADDKGMYLIHADAHTHLAPKKLVLKRQTSVQAPRVSGVSSPYVVLSIPESVNGQITETMYLLDMTNLSLTPLPPVLGGDDAHLVTAAVKSHDGSPVLYYLTEIPDTLDMKLFSYDLKTGAEKVLLEADQKRGLQWMQAKGEYVYVSGASEVLQVTDEGVKSVINEKRGLHMGEVNEDGRFVYVAGGSLTGGMNRYAEETAMVYDPKTGASTPLLPAGTKGSQTVVHDNSLLSGSKLVTNFIPSQAPDPNGLDDPLPGTLQFWHIAPGQAAKLIFERKLTYGMRLLTFHSFVQGEKQQVYLRSISNGERDWAVRYDMAKGTVAEVDPKTLPAVEW